MVDDNPEREEKRRPASLIEDSFKSKLQIGLIEILFSVVLLGSFFVILPVRNGAISVHSGFLFWVSHPLAHGQTILSVILAYLIVITSWHEYHESALHFEMKGWLGEFRFVIDLLLLFLYYLLFVSIVHLSEVFEIAFSIITLYFIWTAIRAVEYRDSPEKTELGRKVLSAIFFAVVAGLIWYLEARWPSLWQYEAFTLIVLSYANLIGYRWFARLHVPTFDSEKN